VAAAAAAGFGAAAGDAVAAEGAVAAAHVLDDAVSADPRADRRYFDEYFAEADDQDNAAPTGLGRAASPGPMRLRCATFSRRQLTHVKLHGSLIAHTTDGWAIPLVEHRMRVQASIHSLAQLQAAIWKPSSAPSRAIS
jgi:hypothetical protein